MIYIGFCFRILLPRFLVFFLPFFEFGLAFFVLLFVVGIAPFNQGFHVQFKIDSYRA